MREVFQLPLYYFLNNYYSLSLSYSLTFNPRYSGADLEELVDTAGSVQLNEVYGDKKKKKKHGLRIINVVNPCNLSMTKKTNICT